MSHWSVIEYFLKFVMDHPQPVHASSKLIETLEQGMKYVQR